MAALQQRDNVTEEELREVCIESVFDSAKHKLTSVQRSLVQNESILKYNQRLGNSAHQFFLARSTTIKPYILDLFSKRLILPQYHIRYSS